MKCTLIFATEKEACCTIERLEGRKENDHCYAIEDGKLCIIGMGTKDLTPFIPYFESADIILNAGLAGSLSKRLPRESFHRIRTVSYGQTTLQLAEAGAALTTRDTPLHSYQEGIELVDMEGFHIAALARQLGKPCALYKIVSDLCDEQSSEEIRSRLPKLSLALAHYMNEYINEIRKVIPTGSFT
jgi:hypothetical protein